MGLLVFFFPLSLDGYLYSGSTVGLSVHTIGSSTVSLCMLRTQSSYLISIYLAQCLLVSQPL